MEDFRQVRILPEVLIPVSGTPTAEENKALGQALHIFSLNAASRDLSPLTDFIDEYPESPWIPALLAGMGGVYYRSGYFSKALDAWGRAWELGKGKELSGEAQALLDRSFAEMLRMHARLGHVDVLEKQLEANTGHAFSGSAEQMIGHTRTAIDRMRNQPEVSFRCGPYAVMSLYTELLTGQQIPEHLLHFPSTAKGVAMGTLVDLAKESGLDLRAVKRTPGTPPIFPSVVHWKLDHYAALIKEQDGRYLLKDPTFGEELWIEPAALDQESSGYFLVPADKLTKGWQEASREEIADVWGRGDTGSAEPDNTGPDEPQCPPEGPCPTGMATHSVAAMLLSLCIRDRPMDYTPAFGPSPALEINYNEKDVSQPANFYYTNFGRQWTSSWISFVEVDPIVPGATIIACGPRGNIESVTDFDSGSQSYAPSPKTSSTLSIVMGEYIFEAPDGSRKVYGESDGASVYPRRMFLTEIQDPQGHAITFDYDGNLRITTVTDATGLVSTLHYDHPTDIYKVTKITDPFGRESLFNYDQAGRLVKITDVVGIESEFAYDQGNVITSLTTPYGTTRFDRGGMGMNIWMEITDPQGDKERIEYKQNQSVATYTLPSGINATNSYTQYRNTFYWDKKAMYHAPGDYTKAKIYHWTHTSDLSKTSGTPEYVKMPLEDPVWYNYVGQTNSILEGTQRLPTKVGRVLDDNSTQLQQFEYNTQGNLTKSTDPAGRETKYTYDSNGIDVIEVEQKVGSSTYETLSETTYNSAHQPLTVTAADGQVTTYTYNGNGQILTVTNANSEVTTFSYYSADVMDGPEVLKQRKDRLEKIDGPLTGSDDVVTFDYDAFGRVRTVTDSEGYTTTTDYDALNRVTQVTYPDSTFQQVIYNRLDAEWTRDRLGRWSRAFHNALRQVVAVQDPQGLITQFEWCLCGALQKLWDPAGNLTRWTWDINGRITEKIYADGKTTQFAYETRTSRLKSVTDAMDRTANYEYFTDDNLKKVSYTDDNDDPITNTPDVSYTYETYHNRLATHTDGIGTTSYSYVPTNGGDSVYGDGTLASIDGPWSNDTISYEYDKLGRVKNRQIDGTANEVTSVFDDAGRVTSVTNNLGTFDYAYVNETSRVDHVDLPNGQRTQFDYYDNSGDQRLKEIKHLAPNLTDVISQHNYVYNSYGQITQWKQDHDALADPVRYHFAYDNTDRLVAAVQRNDTTSAVLKRYNWGYDKAGNRVSEQVDGGTGEDTVLQAATANSLNQLTGLAPSGPTVFRGAIDEPGTVTVNGNAARMGPGGTSFEGWANLATGPNTVTIAATDENSNTDSQQYEVEVAGGSTRTLTYDDNGNLLSDGLRTYEWDAKNRLLAIQKAGDWRTEFTYDGLDRRVKLEDIDLSGTPTTTREVALIWDGMAIQEERDSTGATVQKRYFGQGMEIPSGVNTGEYLYQRDHLGSVRELIDNDSSAAVRARYDYDLWGKRSANLITSGPVAADFAFTGHFFHSQSGFDLAPYRAYDPETGRWISRDWIGVKGGINEYMYCSNSPVCYIDPSGFLAWWIFPLLPIIAALGLTALIDLTENGEFTDPMLYVRAVAVGVGFTVGAIVGYLLGAVLGLVASGGNGGVAAVSAVIGALVLGFLTAMKVGKMGTSGTPGLLSGPGITGIPELDCKLRCMRSGRINRWTQKQLNACFKRCEPEPEPEPCTT